ncbi:MAG: DUF1294 domain-containing protein, partial [Halobacteriales archaeon]|nr:DUF1294 domain-containing protein [Halobacteriales archaeon]
SLAALNLVGLLLLAVLDKRRARRQGQRVPEAAFHLLALLCAWPGMLLAFLAVRHKTRKLRFQVPFVLASALGTAALLLLFF